MDETQTADPARFVSDYAAILRRRWWLIGLCMVLGALGGFGLSLVQPKVYEANTQVYVQATGAPDSGQQVGSRTNSGINLDTEAQLVQSLVVANRAKTLLKSASTVYTLTQAVTVTVPPNSQVLTISFAAATPKAAQAGSHAFAAAYLANRTVQAQKDLSAQVASLQKQRVALDAQLVTVSAQVAALPTNAPQRKSAEANQGVLSNQITALANRLSPLLATTVTPGSIISDALLPSQPSSPNKLLDIGSGLFAGLLIGLALALLVDRRDRRLHSVAEVRALTGLPVLLELTRGKLPTAVAGRSTPEGQHFGRLRNGVLATLVRPADVARGDQARSHVVLMLGASPGAATGVVAANLCAALARPGHPVTLLCTDPQSPSPALLGVTGDRGLSDLLGADADIGEVQQPSSVSPGVYVVVPGTTAEDDELVADQIGGVIDALLAYSEYLVIEARPAGTSAEGQALAGLAQESFVVLETRRSRREDLSAVVRQFDQVGAPLAGVVVVPEAKPIRRGAGRRDPSAGATRSGSTGSTRATVGRGETLPESVSARSGPPPRT